MDHVGNIVAILQDNSNSEISNTSLPHPVDAMKQSLAVYLKNFMSTNVVKQATAEQSTQKIQRLIDLFFQSLVSPATELRIKRFLGFALD